MSKVTYIVPVYVKPGLLTTCLSTFKKFHPEGNIIVVDDGGPDGQDLEKVCLMFNVKYIRKENGGFASACNVGIAYAESEYVCLVNSDIEFTQPTTEQIENNFALNPKIVIQGGRLFYPDGRIQHGGGFYMWNKMGHYGHGKLPHQAKLTGINAYRLYVTGALLAIKKSWWEDNHFDETYFNDSEDADLCLRAWETGNYVYYDPNITAIHAEGLTRGANEEEKRKTGNWERGEKSRKKLLSKLEKYPFEANQKLQNVLNGELHPDLPIMFKRMGAMGDVLRARNVFAEWIGNSQPSEVIICTQVPEAFKGYQFQIVTQTDEVEVSEIHDLDLAYERRRDMSIEEAYREVLGLPNAKTSPLAFFPNDAFDRLKLKAMTPQMDWSKPYVVVHMGVSWPSKTLPPEFWKEVCIKLLDKGYIIVCVGAEGTYEPNGANMINLVGKTDLSILRAVLEGAECYIGTDSGVLHMADGACPAIGLFTTALPERLVSDKVTPIVTKAPCAGCLHRQPVSTFHLCDYAQNDQRHLACTFSINPYEVADKALELMGVK